MTLRLRLLLLLVGIVAAGLVVADVVTYNSLGSFLRGQVDQQLQEAENPVAQALVRCAEIEQEIGPFGPSTQCSQYIHLPAGSTETIPSGTFGELRDASGSLIGGSGQFFEAQVGNAPPLPANLPGSGDNASSSPEFFDVTSGGKVQVHYQVVAVPEAGGGTLVVAIPLTATDQTLGRLLWIEGLVTAIVLLVLGGVAWFMVRRELAPLDGMATTAGAIAAGDLTRRVPDGDDRSEVGRLGVALNTMLGNIEQAFAAKTASEERLRRFLADASHELRTPLTSIRGYAEMFDRGVRDRPEDLATSMRNIRSEADRMSELVNDLLLLARLDRERPFAREPVDLGEVLTDAVHAVRVTAPDRVITLSELSPATVDGDAGRLRQVADNLLTNAVRHTPPGTPVTVRVWAESGYGVVEVEDRGPGVAPEEQALIFEPFHRADASRARATGGVGLGLAIVAAITRAHGGDVGVRPAAGGGSVFWVRLPLSTVPGSPPWSTGHASGAQFAGFGHRPPAEAGTGG